jgi:hypothetical protein
LKDLGGEEMKDGWLAAEEGGQKEVGFTQRDLSMLTAKVREAKAKDESEGREARNSTPILLLSRT